MTASLASTDDKKSPPEAEGWTTLRRFLPYLWPEGNWPLRRRIIVALAFVLFSKGVTLTLPFAYSGAVDAMSDTGAIDEGALVAVLTTQPLDRTLDYKAPEGGAWLGAFVEVPLGPRKVLGVIWGKGRGDLYFAAEQKREQGKEQERKRR